MAIIEFENSETEQLILKMVAPITHDPKIAYQKFKGDRAVLTLITRE